MRAMWRRPYYRKTVGSTIIPEATHSTMTRGIRNYWAPVSVALVAPAAIYCCYLWWLQFAAHPKGTEVTFLAFMKDWGGVLGLAVTILLTIFAVSLPSRLEAQVKEIADQLRQPLMDFRSIYKKALELLLSLKREPGSVFIMTSATPVFGIEFGERDQKHWESELK